MPHSRIHTYEILYSDGDDELTLYVVRHGLTKWNEENRVCGITDIPLADRGIAQAIELSLQVKEKQIEIILCSPLMRAMQTAEIISKALLKPYIVDARLKEQNYGAFEGASRNDETFKAAKQHFPHKMHGGESILQVTQRIFNFLDELKENYESRKVLIVTHGGVCRVVHAYFHDLSNEQYYQFHAGNCGMNEYEL